MGAGLSQRSLAACLEERLLSRLLLVSLRLVKTKRKMRTMAMPFAFLRRVLQILVIFVMPLDKKPLRNLGEVKFCLL